MLCTFHIHFFKLINLFVNNKKKKNNKYIFKLMYTEEWFDPLTLFIFYYLSTRAAYIINFFFK